MSFKDLAIDREKIKPTLEGYSAQATVIGPEVKGNTVAYTVKTPGQPDALLNFYFKKAGTTTISPNAGKNKLLSEELAALIKENCLIGETNRGHLYLKKISADEFQVTLDFLREECGATVDVETPIAHGHQYKVHGQQGDTLSFNYFNNGAFSIQGKPLLLYSEVIEILCELLPYEAMVVSQLKTIDTNISAAEVTSDLEAALPNAHSFLGNKINAIIAPSVAYLKVKIDLPDYTSLAFPALKGLEGYLKILFLKHGITISNEGFSDHFRGNPSQLVIASQRDIGCTKTCRAIEKVYDYFRIQRHGLFHVDATPGTSRIIRHRHEADQIINESLLLIEETYTSINA